MEAKKRFINVASDYLKKCAVILPTKFGAAAFDLFKGRIEANLCPEALTDLFSLCYFDNTMFFPHHDK